MTTETTTAFSSVSASVADNSPAVEMTVSINHNTEERREHSPTIEIMPTRPYSTTAIPSSAAAQYLQQFREALMQVVMAYAQKHPDLDRQAPFYHQKMQLLLGQITDRLLVPTRLWEAVAEIEKQLPRKFYHRFKNPLGDALKKVLTGHPKEQLRDYFEQANFDANQCSLIHHLAEKTAWQEQLHELQRQQREVVAQLAEIRAENIRLNEENHALREENHILKSRLLSMDTHHREEQAAFIESHERMLVEVKQLKEKEAALQEKIRVLVEGKSELFTRCHAMSNEKSLLQAQKEKLMEDNKRLAMENFALKKQLENLVQLVPEKNKAQRFRLFT